MRLLAISGSLRRDSYNSALLQAAAAACPRAAEFVIWRGLADIPAYDEDLDHTPPPAVTELREEIARAHAVLIATPEYNGSIPGALKNALDWASRPFPDNCLRRKPVAVIGASTGRLVRRPLGAGRPAQGAEDDRGLRPRDRAANSIRARSVLSRVPTARATPRCLAVRHPRRTPPADTAICGLTDPRKVATSSRKSCESC